MNRARKFPFVALTATLGLIAVLANPAGAAEQDKKGAKVTLPVARSIALHIRPGKITDEELEREQGGSGLRYSFDIAHNKQTYEVGVDAITGKVLENKLEGKHPD